MKFNVPSKSLYSFVSAVNKVINSKNAMTILNNFLFYLEGDKLQVVACDMENTLVARIDVMDAEGSGKFCIDAARIIELLKELPDQGIQFVINDENLAVEIIYSSGTFNLMAINGSEYPYDPEAATVNDSEVASFELPASNILRGIDNTIFAASHDDLRPQLAGVFWDIHPEDITFVASDTKQLVKFLRLDARHRLSSPPSLATCSRMCLHVMAMSRSTSMRSASCSKALSSASLAACSKADSPITIVPSRRIHRTQCLLTAWILSVRCAVYRYSAVVRVW